VACRGARDLTALRAALYWTPDPADPLARAGASWLGWDAELGTAVEQPAVANIDALTAAPRIYGFHATLRPPMRLATGWDAFLGAAHEVAARVAAFDLPALVVDDTSGFLALRESAPCPALRALADACVEGTERHRLRPDAPELTRRRAAGLTASQDALLLRWGYPYVMEEWRFHMTLSRRLDAREMAQLRPAAAAHFGAALATKRRLDSISVCTQRPGERFLVAERIRLKEGLLF
jgi:hypothetical protein